MHTDTDFAFSNKWVFSDKLGHLVVTGHLLKKAKIFLFGVNTDSELIFLF